MQEGIQQSEIVVGLDIGTTKICAIVGVKNEYGKLEVLGMGKAVSDGVIRGIVININKTILAIEKAIAEAGKQAGIPIKEVNVGIAGQHIKSSTHHGSITRDSVEDVITVEDIRRLSNDIYKIVMPPGCEIIHVMPQEYTVDYEGGITEPVGISGVQLGADFHVVTADTNAVRNINRCVTSAGLEIKKPTLEPLASSISVLSDEEKKGGVCLVDIGGGTTDLAIFQEGILRHTAVIPFGGNILTTDIKEGCKVMQNQAELLKVKFGKAIAEKASPNEIVSIPGLRNRPPREISIRNLAHIIEARMQEIIELVHAEIITSGWANKLVFGLVITGGGSQLSHLGRLFEFMTGMDTRIGYPNEHLGKSKVEAVKSPMYATAVGLVLLGFMPLDQRDSHYTEEQLTETGRNRVSRGIQAVNDFTRSIKAFLIDDKIDNKHGY